MSNDLSDLKRQNELLLSVSSDQQKRMRLLSGDWKAKSFEKSWRIWRKIQTRGGNRKLIHSKIACQNGQEQDDCQVSWQI